MSCAEIEILLCDYLDGALPAAGREAVEEHLAGCGRCSETWAEVRSAVAFMERAAPADPPAELLTRILHHIPGRDLGRQKDRGWWRRLRGGWLGPLLSPRYAMGMAMTILSFSMIFKFAGIQPRQLKPSDLDPVKVWSALDDRAHRSWDRAVKYYDNLRLVIEIQSRLKEWTEQDQAAPRSGENGAAGNGSDGRGKQ